MKGLVRVTFLFHHPEVVATSSRFSLPRAARSHFTIGDEVLLPLDLAEQRSESQSLGRLGLAAHFGQRHRYNFATRSEDDSDTRSGELLTVASRDPSFGITIVRSYHGI
jgi:hypothetical protein